MTEDTLRQPAMFLDLDRMGACQPLTRDVRPTIGQRHQSKKFLKSLPLGEMSLFQTKTPRLQATEQGFYLPPQGIVPKYLVTFRAARHNHVFAFGGAHPHQRYLFSQDSPFAEEQNSNADFLCAEQIPGSHQLIAAGIRDTQILFDPNAKGNLLPAQVTKPIPPNKLAVSGHKRERTFAEKSHILFQQLDSLRSVGTTFLFQHRPQQRKGHSLEDHAQHEDVQRRSSQIPIGAINGNEERLWDAKQFDNQKSDLGKRHVKESQKSLTSFVMRVLFRPPAHHRRDLDETDGLDLNQGENKLRQKVESGFVPSYILRKRSLQVANVGHCALVLSRNVWRQILARIAARWPFMQCQRSIFVLY